MDAGEIMDRPILPFQSSLSFWMAMNTVGSLSTSAG
jgi:hypothetical protein